MNTDNSNKYRLENFLDSYLQELAAMSDMEVLDGADPAALRSEGLGMLASAKAEASKRRLSIARARMSEAQTTTREPKVGISAAEARTFLKNAVNDQRFTLAARELIEMSDEDVVQLYEKILSLKEQNDDVDENK